MIKRVTVFLGLSALMTGMGCGMDEPSQSSASTADNGAAGGDNMTESGITSRWRKRGSGGTTVSATGGRVGSGGSVSTPPPGTGGVVAVGTGGVVAVSTGGVVAVSTGGVVAVSTGGVAVSTGGRTVGTGGVVGSGGTVGTTGTHVSRDANGWTVVLASTDSRTIYVSSSQGNDSNDGMSTATPRKTLASATSLLRPGYPDHLLLKSGDSWYETLGGYKSIGGRSTDEPMLISSYGTGARPQLKTNGGGGGFLGHYTSTVGQHLYIIGIDFYDSAKDPASSDYRSGAPSVTGISWLDGGDDLLIEDCYFHFLANGIVIQYVTGPSPQNITIRRNVITDQYSYTGHAQGIFLGGLLGTNVIEQNIFDHNAWNDTAGVPADVFNHHVYIADSTNVSVKNNMFGRDGSLSLKFVYYGDVPTVASTDNSVVFNNFFFEGEVGLSMAYGGSSSPAAGSCFLTGSCFRNSTIRQNVMVQVNRDNPTARGLGWGMELKNSANTVVDSNIFTDFSFTGNTFAIALDDDNDNSVSSNNTIQNNLMYRIHDAAISVSPRPGWFGIKVTKNTIQDPDQGAPMTVQQGSFASTSYSGNSYAPMDQNRFAIVNSSNVSYSTWLSDSGETGSAVHTTSYPDPGRNLDTYLKSLSPSSTLTQFYSAIRSVSKANWHPEYTGPAINDYIRAGFGQAALGNNP